MYADGQTDEGHRLVDNWLLLSNRGTEVDDVMTSQRGDGRLNNIGRKFMVNRLMPAHPENSRYTGVCRGV